MCGRRRGAKRRWWERRARRNCELRISNLEFEGEVRLLNPQFAIRNSRLAIPQHLPMIIVKLSGGLGNQMFQYAAGRRLALVRSTTLKLDLSFFAGNAARSYRLG